VTRRIPTLSSTIHKLIAGTLVGASTSSNSNKSKVSGSRPLRTCFAPKSERLDPVRQPATARGPETGFWEVESSQSIFRIILAQHVESEGKRKFEEICARDLERIVAKRKMWIYNDDGNSWLKIENGLHSQAEGRHELLIGARRG
jgi:hypothetical protein